LAYSFAQGRPSGAGVWVWPTGDRRYPPGWAQWSYTAPGTTRLLSAKVALSYTPRLLSHHCVRVAAYVGDEQRGGTVFCKPPGPPAGVGNVDVDLGDPAENPTAKQLVLRIEIPCKKNNDKACNKYIPAAPPEQNGVRFSTVDMVLVDDDKPVPAPAGEWWDLRDGYVNGQGTHGLTLAASDAGAGITRVAVEEVGVGELDAGVAPCDPTHHTPELDARICPQRFSADTTIDARPLAEGKHTYRESARDVAENGGVSDPWVVYVDRTAPFGADGFDASLDTDTNEALVSWNSDIDPPLADGSPGSGISIYRYRFQRGQLPWPSEWSTTPDPWFAIPNAIVGEVIRVEVQAIDGVGNIGPVTSGSASVAIPDLTTEDLGEGGEPEDGDLPPELADLDELTRIDDTTIQDAYHEMLCHDGSPCGDYNRRAAAGYALRWARHRNNTWPFFGDVGGRDCTNFVSQALWHGGMRFMRAEGYNNPDANNSNILKFHKGEGSWWAWFQTDNDAFGGPRQGYDNTESWALVDKLYRHLIDYDLGERVPRGERLHVGDLVFFNLHGLGECDLHHVDIISRITSSPRKVYVCQHSPGRCPNLKKRKDAIEKENHGHNEIYKDWEWIIVRPKHSAANIPTSHHVPCAPRTPRAETARRLG